MFKNKELRGKCGSKKEKLPGELEKLYNEELHQI
jgi:hypothetical protein